VELTNVGEATADVVGWLDVEGWRNFPHSGVIVTKHRKAIAAFLLATGALTLRLPNRATSDSDRGGTLSQAQCERTSASLNKAEVLFLRIWLRARIDIERSVQGQSKSSLANPSPALAR
jgi:hypothetical protein